MNVVIFGPPGAGKGTQAQNIVKKFNLHQVSTGDLLRTEIKNKSEIGKEIEEIISKGDFATDDIVNKLIKKIIFDPQKKNKLIFDGYPRSLSQAKNLNLLLSNIASSQILSSKNIIIIHRNKTTKDNFDKSFKIVREEIYGSSKIIFGYFNL